MNSQLEQIKKKPLANRRVIEISNLALSKFPSIMNLLYFVRTEGKVFTNQAQLNNKHTR